MKENPYDLESWSVLVREAQVRKLKLVTLLRELIPQHLDSVKMIDNPTSCCLGAVGSMYMELAYKLALRYGACI